MHERQFYFGFFCYRLFRLVGFLAAMMLMALAVVVTMPVPAAAQTVSQYSNAVSGTITDVNCGTSAQITRSFNVVGNGIVGDVNLGIFLAHSYRSDLRITLQSPAGTLVTVMTWTGNVQSGDNMNDLFDDEATNAIATHNATAIDPLTPVPPAYSHSFKPSNPLSAFDGQNAAGTWTLVVCDAVAVDTGTFNRADLYITTTALSSVKTSTIISDPINGITNPKAIPGAVVAYCVLTTNNGTIETPAYSNVTITEPIPAQMAYIAGSMFSGTSCATATTIEDDNAIGADESDPLGMSISGANITGTAPSLATGGSFAMLFRVTVN